jgi:hypothetical protein
VAGNTANRRERRTSRKPRAKAFIGAQQERVTVNEILDDVIEAYKQGGKRAIRREVSPSMESHLKRLCDYFGAYRAMKVGTKHVKDFIGQLKAKNRSLQLLSQAYNYEAGFSAHVLYRRQLQLSFLWPIRQRVLSQS